MIHKGETVLCAVSGGTDSMCLLRLLHALSQRYGFTVEAATFDHRIRSEGAQDAAFVRRCCEQWDIPCHCGAGDVPAAAAQRGRGLEETARSLRYAFLEDTAEKIGAQRIATAHNADDNAETLLLHLLRGSGLKGLGGIDPVQGRLIRPLLGVSREEIEAYCAATHTPHVEDATNADTAYTRNYLRHQVLPLLRERNPNLLTTLGRTAESLRRDSEFLENEAEKCFRSAERRGNRISYGAEALLSLPEALQMRLVQQMAESLLPGCVLTTVHRERVVQLCRSGRPSAACLLGGNLWARREYQRIVLSLEAGEEEPEKTLLCCGESVRFHGRILTCEEAICPEGKFNQAYTYYLRWGE
jgi:tRNA(Ile)-lysidine synthase